MIFNAGNSSAAPRQNHGGSGSSGAAFGGPEAKNSPIQNHRSGCYCDGKLATRLYCISFIFSFLDIHLCRLERQVSATYRDLFRHRFAYSLANLGGDLEQRKTKKTIDLELGDLGRIWAPELT